MARRGARRSSAVASAVCRWAAQSDRDLNSARRPRHADVSAWNQAAVAGILALCLEAAFPCVRPDPCRRPLGAVQGPLPLRQESQLAETADHPPNNQAGSANRN